MAIGVNRRLDAGMTESNRDNMHRHPCSQEERGVGMPQVVEAHSPYLACLHYHAELAG